MIEDDYYNKRLKSYETSYRFCFWSFIAVVVMLIVAFLTSCTTTRYVEVPVEHIVYVNKTDTFLSKDSVWLHDSVYIHAKGDTIYFEKWHTKFRDRIEYKVRIDSFIKKDSVAVPYPVEKKLTKWQQAKVDWGGYSMLIVVIFIIAFLWLFLRRTGTRGG